MRWSGLFQTCKQYFPITNEASMLTLNEENTHLIELERISKRLLPYNERAVADYIKGVVQQWP